MKSIIQIIAAGLALVASSWAEETPASPPTAPPVTDPVNSWSLVYLPDLDWTEAEVKETLVLLQHLRPDLVLSVAPCPFAEAIRTLECKPTVIDKTQRANLGEACGLPALPLSSYADNSTFHPFGRAESGPAGLVWLSVEQGASQFNGPASDVGELRAIATMQVRKQLADRKGEVVFLSDSSVPTPAESTWRLPLKGVRYEQAATEVTGFACIRPGSLQGEIPSVEGITKRVPVIHWIHSGADGMEWEVLPTDGGPAIQRSTPASNKPSSVFDRQTVAWTKAPPAPAEVPLWMDDYVNSNPALDTGDTRKQGTMDRRYGWIDHGVPREEFNILRSSDAPLVAGKQKGWDLPRGMIRSPGNLFAIGVGDSDDSGVEPAEGGDDGVNVSLEDLRTDKSILLYYAGLHSAWPSAATWFTDRYVITSGTGCTCDPVVFARNVFDRGGEDDPYLTPQIHAQTIYLFDLQSGKSFFTHSIAPSDNHGRSYAPTERIVFPLESSPINVWSWRTLWKAIEDGYHAKPEPAPFATEAVAELAKLPMEPGLQWKDLGIWPRPEIWQLASETADRDHLNPSEKPLAGGDSYLSYTESSDGQRRYTIAIAGYPDKTQFSQKDPVTQVVAHADLFTTGKGCLPQLDTIQRMGDEKRYLALAGTFQKPGNPVAGRGRWMLLIDLLHHRSWSAHW